MTSLSHFDPDIPNFHNLALFICHLFVDGNFRSGHIIHDSSDINSNIPEFLSEVQSTCRDSIPWLSTDVAEDRFGDPSPSASPWQPDQNTDDILQLIFLDPQHFPTNIDPLKDMITYYHFFVFDSTDKMIFSELAKMDSSVLSSALIVNYNCESDSVSVYKPSILSDPLYIQTADSFIGNSNLFDATFKIYENDWIITTNYRNSIASCNNRTDIERISEISGGSVFFANYFANQLNARYLNLSLVACSTWTSELVQRKMQKIYKELSISNEPINKKILEKLKVNHLKIAHLTFNEHVAVRSDDTNILPLYPYTQKEQSVIYVYAIGLKREGYRIVMTGLGFRVFSLTIVFLLLATVLLYYVRKILQLRRSEFVSCLLDIHIVIVAGGNVNVRHKIERWIIGICLIGSFFLNTFWCESILFPSFLTYDSTIRTIEDLAKLNPPIYTSVMQKHGEGIIKEALKVKFGTMPKFRGSEFLERLIQNVDTHFAYVVPKKDLVLMHDIMGERVYDVLQESLGALNDRFHLTSNQRVPERIIHEINRKTSLMMQSGLHHFYKSFSTFWSTFRERLLSVQEAYYGVVPLTVGQLIEMLKLYIFYIVICCFVFLIEIMVDRWKRWKWQQNNQRSILEMDTIKVVVASEQPVRPETCAGPSTIIDIAGPSRVMDSASSSRYADSAGPSNISGNVIIRAEIHHIPDIDSDSSD